MDLRGSYPRVYTKQVVEECLQLHVAPLREALAVGGQVEGRLAWGGEPGASVQFAVEPLGGNLAELRLRYALGADQDAQLVDEVIALISSPQPFGGVQWMFQCPLVHDGRPCGRRARILFLPPGGTFFGCRPCHGLSYSSRQQRRDPMRARDLSGDGDRQGVAGPGGLVAVSAASHLPAMGMAEAATACQAVAEGHYLGPGRFPPA